MRNALVQIPSVVLASSWGGTYTGSLLVHFGKRPDLDQYDGRRDVDDAPDDDDPDVKWEDYEDET